MSGISIVSNGTGYINGKESDSGVLRDTHKPYEVPFPETKEQLNGLLSKYQQLAKTSKEAKERHGHFAKFLDTKEEYRINGSNNMNASPAPFEDPTVEERKAIERVLYKVSEQYEKFSEEEAKFYDSLVSESSKDSGDLDCTLLFKQIAGLQLISKDLDLPESLQAEYTEFFNGQKSPLVEVKNFVDSLFLMKDYFGDFMSRAHILGLQVPQSTGTIDPLYAPIGNYYKEQIISSKVANRLKELENLPANLGTFDSGSLFKSDTYDDLKIKVLIELKSLQLLAKQKQLKKNLVVQQATNSHYEDESLNKVPLALQARRSIYIRPKIIQAEPERLALKLMEKQKLEAMKLKYALHVEKVRQILEYSEDFVNAKLSRFNKLTSLSRHIHNFHSNTEKDESKKMEKTARQRLQALKANDEEAYMKLLDQTKDHRITHLLKQTNSFLDSLAQAVRVQQVELGADVPTDSQEPEEGAKDSVDDLREKIDYYQVAHRIKEEVTEQPKILVGGKLKEYQIKGLQWMVSLYNNKLNGILADEMGLGKTIQSISLVTYLIEKKHESKFLVVVPLSTITNWTLEFEKWAPTVRIIVYKGSQQQRKALQSQVREGHFQVLLTTYEYIIRERPLLAKFNYSHMIIDEGHRMKNANSKLSVTLRSYYKTKNRLILTGTPLQNNLPELWALLNFVLPKIFNSVKSFDEWFNTPFANTGSQEKIELTEEESLLVIRRLHKVLRPFLLRRLKKDVEKDLPDKVEKVVKCNLSGLQEVLYQQMLKHNALFVGVDVGGAKSGIKGLNNKVMQLRKICNHPFVFDEVETVLNSSRLTNDLIWRVSGKFELLDRILPKFKASNHRVLMFFQMTLVMNIMEDFLRWRDMKYLRLDGSTRAEDRQDMLKMFNAENSDYFCFLLSTRAGGLGLNLQTADTVIIFDTDWNPHQDLQAQDRAHRIGQKNEVRILRLISNDSVEEVILERAHQKLDIDGKVIQAGKFDNKSTAEEQEAFLKRLLEAEANRDANEENVTLDDEELNEILARSEGEKELFAKIDDERKATDKMEARKGVYSTRLITKKELPSVFTEDISHHFEKDNKELSQKRVRKRVKYDDGLTEEQWLMAMDDDNDTVEDAVRRKEERMARRRKNNREDSESIEGTPIADGEEDDDDLPRKRLRRSVTPQTYEMDGVLSDGNEAEDDILLKCSSMLDEVCDLTAEDGHNVSEVFLTLPSRKLYPDYYKIIKQPISINQIRKNIKQENYNSYEAFLDSLRTMCENAKTYNEEDSWIYKDAATIEDFIK